MRRIHLVFIVLFLPFLGLFFYYKSSSNTPTAQVSQTGKDFLDEIPLEESHPKQPLVKEIRREEPRGGPPMAKEPPLIEGDDDDDDDDDDREGRKNEGIGRWEEEGKEEEKEAEPAAKEEAKLEDEKQPPPPPPPKEEEKEAKKEAEQAAKKEAKVEDEKQPPPPPPPKEEEKQPTTPPPPTPLPKKEKQPPLKKEEGFLPPPKEGPPPPPPPPPPTEPNKPEEHLVNKVMGILRRDGFMLYDYPGIDLLIAYDFTIEMFYRTKRQNVTEVVAIYSNVRNTPDALPYGRTFQILLTPEGRVKVIFEAGDYKTRDGGNTRGEMLGTQILDDDRWHHVCVTRSKPQERIFLFIDGIQDAEMWMPNGIDINDQEQRTVVGGGNDRHFRECFIDNLALFKAFRKPTPESILKPHDCDDGDLAAYFDFEDELRGHASPAIFRDSSIMRGDALRMGTMHEYDPFVVDNDMPLARSPNCPKRPDQGPPDPKYLIVSCLIFKCKLEDDVRFKPGHLYELEAYIGPLWLDMHRLNMKMLLLLLCVPDFVIERYQTANVQFVKGDFMLQDMQTTCSMDTNRYLLYDEYDKRTQYLDQAEYIAHIDLRDARMIRRPNWEVGRFQEVDFVVQNIRNTPTMCNGFHMGRRFAVRKALELVRAEVERTQCRIYDQDSFNNVNNAGLFASNGIRTALNMDLINTQHVRRFDKTTVFEHGIWWMTRNNAGTYPFSQAYPVGIP